MPDRSGSVLIRTGAGIVATLILIGLVAPWLAPYPPNEVLDATSGRERPPGTTLQLVELSDERWWLVDAARRTEDGLVVERLGKEIHLDASKVLNLTEEGVADERHFLLGSDRYGRDLLSRLLYGTRISLGVGVATVVLAVALGLGVGSLAAMGGPWVDGVLMRFADGLRSLPRLFFLIALAALYQPSNLLIVFLLGATTWTGISRIARAQLISTRERDFVLAARASGLSPLRILWSHLLPNSLTPVVATATLLVSDVILAESALSFLGLGLQPPQASWGTILSEGRTVLIKGAWWIGLLPGVAILLAVIGFTLLGDGLRDRLDPTSRVRT